MTIRKGRPAKTHNRGGNTSGASRKRRGLAAPPAAYVAQVVGGGVGTRSGGSGEVGALAASADSNDADKKDAIWRRRCADKQLKQVLGELDDARAEIAELKRVAVEVAPVFDTCAQSDTRTQSDTEPPLRKYKSESSKKRAAKKLRMFLMLYPADVQADLVARAILVEGVHGPKSGISVSLVKELLSHPRMARVMKQYARELLGAARKHMMESVFSAANFVTARRLLRLSYRKLEWLRRLLSHDGKCRRVMHPDHDTCAPAMASVPAMKADEAELVAARGGVVQQEDGRGAVCEDLDRTLCQALAHAHGRGELVSTGLGGDEHIFMWGGGGFMARKRSKWVQLGVILCSTTVLNQSPNNSRFVMNAEMGEDYMPLSIRLEELRPELQRLARGGGLRDSYGELPVGVGKGVQFAIGGDKPWIHTVLGRRNMNHTHFSVSCKCTRENISCLDCEGGQDHHYSVDLDQMCRDSHICPNMWMRGGDFVPFVCGCCAARFDTAADVEAEEDRVMGMEPDTFVGWGERFSLSHGGRFWGWGPLLPARWVWSDPLHLFLNLFNVQFDECVDFFLQHEFVSSENKVLIAECDSIAKCVNKALAEAHIVARFGTSERKSFCGNDLRALMEHPTVLPAIMSAVRPLYQRMEPLSFAAAKARKERARMEERLEKEKEMASAGTNKRAARVDANEFNKTAGISAQAAARVRKYQAALKAA